MFHAEIQQNQQPIKYQFASWPSKIILQLKLNEPLLVQQALNLTSFSGSVN
jgi:hypothetical protein